MRHNHPSQSSWTVVSLIILPLLGTFTVVANSIQLVDVSSFLKPLFRNEASPTSQKYLIETMTGGVALFDYDRDGDLDIFFDNGAKLLDPMPEGALPDKSDPRFWNRLYRNDGNFHFTDVTKQAGLQGYGYGMGVAVGDYNNDGWPDLYVTNYGQNILYRNNGDGTFTDVTSSAGVAAGGWSAGAIFVDYDRDGFLDLFVARYVQWDFANNPYCGEKKPGYRAYCHPDEFQPITHLLFRNRGDGTFEDVSTKAGISQHPGKGLGVAINDFDKDGWIDILVANDSFPQQLFRNRGDGTFEEVALFTGLAYDADGNTFAGMGVDFLDYDNDSWPDAVINALALQRYAIFRNNQGFFEYASGPTGLASLTQLHSGWGMKFVDLDNDGWKDLFIGQGHVMDNIELTQPNVRYLEPPLLLRNLGGRFQNISAESGDIFQRPIAARGVAFGDLNNDGAIDIVINCNNGPAIVLRNQGNTNHWILIDTVGTHSNRDGIGAIVRVTDDRGRTQYSIVSTGASYLSANDKRVHFGLADSVLIREIEIKWPSGIVQRLEKIPANQILRVTEPGQFEHQKTSNTE